MEWLALDETAPAAGEVSPENHGEDPTRTSSGHCTPPVPDWPRHQACTPIRRGPRGCATGSASRRQASVPPAPRRESSIPLLGAPPGTGRPRFGGGHRSGPHVEGEGAERDRLRAP